MRSDENVKTLRGGQGDLGDFGSESPRNSFSGGERDNLFLSDDGEQFYDIAGVSGLDDPGDGRTSSLLDFDRDGWTDFVVASATEPTLKLYRNRIGEEMYPNTKTARMVALLLEGGNKTAAPRVGWSPREGYGAVLNVSYEEGGKVVKFVREYRCGDGRAAQNSRTMLIGIGQAPNVDIEVLWPSGKRQLYDDVPAGKLVLGFENPENAQAKGKTFLLEDYVRELPDNARAPDVEHLRISLTAAQHGDSPGNRPRLHLYTAMSTHCKSCKKAQAQVKMLREVFGTAVGVWGVPVDLEESPEVLDEYVQAAKPYYDVLTNLERSERVLVKEHIARTFLDEVTPATIVTDDEGNVLHTMQGVPTISEVRGFLADLR